MSADYSGVNTGIVNLMTSAVRSPMEARINEIEILTTIALQVMRKIEDSFGVRLAEQNRPEEDAESLVEVGSLAERLVEVGRQLEEIRRIQRRIMDL